MPKNKRIDLKIMDNLEINELKNNFYPRDSLIINYRIPSIRRYTSLCFNKSSKEPQIIMKFSENREILENEYKNLCEIHFKLNSYAPKPVFFKQLNDLYVLGINYIKGEKLDNIKLNNKIIDRIIFSLADFHKKICKGKICISNMKISNFYEYFCSICKEDAGRKLIESTFTKILMRLEEIKDVQFPNIIQHGDFTNDNILVTKREIFLLDWENFNMINIPFFDLVTFFISLNSRFEPNSSNIHPYGSEFINSFRRNLAIYCDFMLIPFEYIRYFFPASLLIFYQLNYIQKRYPLANLLLEWMKYYEKIVNNILQIEI